MKKLFLIFLTFIFVLGFKATLSAQDIPSKVAAKEAATAYLKNAVLKIDNISYDYRILKHYTQEELLNMSDAKRNQVHFIYTESYRVLDMGRCPSMNITDIDIAKIETLRKENTSTIVKYGNDCQVTIELLSRNELNIKLNAIK